MKVFKILLPLYVVLYFSCAEKSKSVNDVNANSVSNDTIPELRKSINKKPVAAYIVPMGNPKLDRKFGVEVFETANTFKFLLKMYYDGITENDTITIPNFGITPVVKAKAGNEKLSCIIGFLDRKNDFKEYKLLCLKGGNLRLSTIKYYGVSAYSK